ncbi:tRNA uridine-5-carboxymethylaminomethyl(34) synthesis GTPase MnmE [Enterobacteriaceae endosymbiont of Macroplea appendiculata]|uniref:tRNA uridine-5-carboxymethylaminomethyl(34) synthesis GTPase MnmE n=1 Tax=Enterobacteriaceae endosymbiont of Macroplea appendiculata TaxID=2675790 RepID=UPI0014493634|nr:tRNA uridine-5-carboxymethylaminomethyl(34) synthesis GTPase MnmE [Enterobacteriaceae endosymbiont of Macroplea appendiculata]QJC31012.1 tRNA uridine-5-carboxymethylaminomethyl(34) synthesis GTPase MnmE [Enterobacteriaceae endosymbiont of Macroplea appendiculata]
MNTFIDTIIARATPLGKGGIGIIRISGQKSCCVIKYILHIKSMKPRYAYYLPFYLQNIIVDKGIVLWFPQPYSYTGEDILELHCHGGIVLLEMLIHDIIMNISGIRIANPGEFTERAFLNKKINLLEAEAVSALIAAESKAAIFAATNLMNGTLLKLIQPISNNIIKIRTILETNIEFMEYNEKQLYEKIYKIINYVSIQTKQIIKYLLCNLKIQEGIKITLIGPTNSGKSSLMNLLTQKNISIITNIPGTTRDVLSTKVNFNSVLINLVDTAGIRKTKDYIESIGIKKTFEEMNNSDYIFLVVEDMITENQLSKFLHTVKKNINKKFTIIIRNKIDITNSIANIKVINGWTNITLSVYNKQGISLLMKYIKDNIINQNNNENQFTSKQRHINIFNNIYNLIEQSKQMFVSKKQYIDIILLSENFRLMQIELDSIVGKFTSQNLLDNIFSDFCVGK